MTIRLFYAHVTDKATRAVTDVMKTGWVGLGQKTAEFEGDFAKYVGTKYAVGLNSATSALHLAMVVSDVVAGDQVLTTPMTFVSPNTAILYQQATPVFVDIEPDTLNLNVDRASILLTPKTKAIVVVHYGGNPVNLDKVYEFADEKRLKVIEDAAHACGASYKGKKIGSFGLTCFSFHAVKNLPCGDGGMITTNNEEVYQRLLKLRWCGIDKSTYDREKSGQYKWEYNIEELGYKYHMNDITAAMGVEHLKKLDEWNLYRKNLVDRYKENLPEVTFIGSTLNTESSNHLCVISVKNRDVLHKRLGAAKIESSVHYKPNHYYPVFRDTAKHGSLDEAEEAYDNIISLPCHLKLTYKDVDFISSVVRESIY